MPKANTARYNEKREAILDAGARVLNRKGLSAVRLTDVAAEIGLKRPGIVYYFGNVEELAEALYGRSLSQLERRIEIAIERPTLRDRLAALIDQELDHHAAERRGEAIRRPQLGEIRALSGARRRVLGRRYDRILRRVARLLETDETPGRLIRRLGPAHIVMESIFWLPAWLDEYEPWMFSRVRDALIDVHLHGFRNAPPPRAVPVIGEPPRVETPEIDQDSYLRMATRLICDFGFRGASIDRIAAELGVTKGSFYHHIAQKNELIETCFAHSQQRLSEIQRRASERDLPPHDRLDAALATVVKIQFEGRFPLLRVSALVALESDARAKIIVQAKRNFRWFASEIAAGVANGTLRSADPHVSAQVLGVAVNAVYDLARLYRGEVSSRDADVFCDLLRYGIAAGKGSN